MRLQFVISYQLRGRVVLSSVMGRFSAQGKPPGVLRMNISVADDWGKLELVDGG
jgi:hypothetical protein